MISKLLVKIKEGNKDSMMELINMFHPLLLKYAKSLNYEDAYSELSLFLIELFFDIKLESMRCDSDPVLIVYIKTAMHNQYNHLIKNLINRKKEISMSYLSEEQRHYIESENAVT